MAMTSSSDRIAMYLLMLYVTVDMEQAIKALFHEYGWQYTKIDENGLVHDQSPAHVSNSCVKSLTTSSSSTMVSIQGKSRGGETDTSAAASEKIRHLKDNEKTGQPIKDVIQNGSDAGKLQVISDRRETQASIQSLIGPRHIYRSQIQAKPLADVNRTLVNSKSGNQIKTIKNNMNSPAGSQTHVGQKTLKDGVTVTVTKSVGLKQKDNQRRIKCPICQITFAKSYFRKHLGTHSMVKPFSCSVCSRTFRTNVFLKLHMSVHTGEKPHVCCKCGMKFRTSSQRLCHQKSHLRLYGCQKCGKKFADKFALDYHRCRYGILKTAIKTYKCGKCKGEFYCNYTFNKHTCMKHGHCSVEDLPSNASDPVYRCSQCNKIFGLKSYLMMHMKSHPSKTLPVYCKCPHCPKLFHSMVMWKEHRKSHTKGDQVVHDWNADKSSKLVHSGEKLASHDNIKPIPVYCKCPHCPALFSSFSQLTKHKKSHFFGDIFVPVLSEESTENRPAKNSETVESGSQVKNNVTGEDCGQVEKSIMRNTRMVHKGKMKGSRKIQKSEMKSSRKVQKKKTKGLSEMKSSQKAPKREITGSSQQFQTSETVESFKHESIRQVQSSVTVKGSEKVQTGVTVERRGQIQCGKPLPIYSKCPYCPTLFASSVDLNKHRRSHSEDHKLACEPRGSTKASSGKVQSVWTVENSGKVQSGVTLESNGKILSDVTLKSSGKVQSDVTAASNKKAQNSRPLRIYSKCPHCPQYFPSFSELKKHKESHSEDSEIIPDKRDASLETCRLVQDSEAAESSRHVIGKTMKSRTLPQSDVAMETCKQVQSDVTMETSLQVQNDVTTETFLPVQSDMTLETSLPVQSDVTLETFRLFQSDMTMETCRLVQSNVTMETCRPVQGNVTVDSGRQVQNDVTVECRGQVEIDETVANRTLVHNSITIVSSRHDDIGETTAGRTLGQSDLTVESRGQVEIDKTMANRTLVQNSMTSVSSRLDDIGETTAGRTTGHSDLAVESHGQAEIDETVESRTKGQNDLTVESSGWDQNSDTMCSSREVLELKKTHGYCQYKCVQNKCNESVNYSRQALDLMSMHDYSLYKCEICGKVFKMTEYLREHFCIHSGEKTDV